MAVIGETNVTMSTIRDTLNGAGGSVGNELTSFFGASAKLNIWSKYKPVINPDFSFFDLTTWKSSGYKGKDGRCGLDIAVYTPEQFKAAAKAGTIAWGYNRPYGTSAAPMRLGDFRGYCTTAYNPIGAVVSNGIISDGKVSFSIDVAITGSSTTNLTLNDISVNGIALSNMYMGVYVWGGNNQSLFYTGDSTIGSDVDLTVSVPITTAGAYKFIPFLSSVKQSGTDQAGTIISCNKPAQDIDIVTSGSLRKVIPLGSWNASGTAVEQITATLVNSTTSSVTFTNIKVQLRYGSTGASSSLIATSSYSGSVTVAANSMQTISMPNINSAYDQSKTYWLAGYSSETTETTYSQVEENSPE